MTGTHGELGLDVERCASGILEISVWNQANALRQVTVRRGLEVRAGEVIRIRTTGGGGWGPLPGAAVV